MEQIIFSDILIKFFEKEKWAKDFTEGRLYINQAGKFITEENNFRGDNYEGSQVVSFEDTVFIEFFNETLGEAIKIPLQPKSPIKQSFEGAEKVPIFCAAGLNENNFKKIDDNKYAFNDDFVSYMEQFGLFAVLFSRNEFLQKIHKISDEIKIPVASGDVHYQNFDNKFKHFENIKEQYEQFFCKYISDDRDYDKQNEWRLVFCDTKLINNHDDHYELNIGKLNYATAVISTEALKKGIFSIHEEQETK